MRNKYVSNSVADADSFRCGCLRAAAVSARILALHHRKGQPDSTGVAGWLQRRETDDDSYPETPRRCAMASVTIIFAVLLATTGEGHQFHNDRQHGQRRPKVLQNNNGRLTQYFDECGVMHNERIPKDGA